MGKYTLKPGENIWDVASQFNTTAEEIARLNNTSDPFSIKKNMTINVPEAQSAVVSDQTRKDMYDNIANNTVSIPSYDKTRYEDTKEGGAAAQAYKNALGAVSGYGSFNYGKQTELDNIMQSILERKPFTYNFNEDAFYQMYKDKYQKQGKMAAANVMGQAAALTGGYGNSYAATAGNQAYLGYLENLNDIIPELYQMAYDKYSQEGQDMYNQYGLLSDDYDRQRALHAEGYQRLVDAANAARSDYYSGAESFYDAQDRANKALYDEYDMVLKRIEADNDNINAQNKALSDYNKWYAEFVAQYGITPESTYQQTIIEDTAADPLSTVDQSVIDKVQRFTTAEGQANYIDSLDIDESAKFELLDKYGVKELTDKDWELVNDGGGRIGIDRNAVVRDPDTGNEYDLGELFKELKKTMKNSEARDYIKQLQKDLGI